MNQCPVSAVDQEFFAGLDEPLGPCCHDCQEHCIHNAEDAR